MKILVIGSGGREHSLVWKLNQCENVSKIICAPGNAGISQIAECISIAVDNIEGLVSLAKTENFDLVVVGPEIPLSMGLADKLRGENIPVFGPNKSAAQLESSKAFSKDFMARHNIPTAKYGVFTVANDAINFLESLSAPFVLKASGLAAGKGVIIAPDLENAKAEVIEMLSGKFGDASNELVIEEFMHGEEASFFVLCNEKSAIALPICQDHKRAFDDDMGPNTGGMGAYAPTSLVNTALQDKIMREIVYPTLEGMKQENNPYNGVLYVGLMIENGFARVVEYNCRFGDPECQILMQFMGSDFADVLMKIAKEEEANIKPWQAGLSAATIVMAAKGYPDAYEKNGIIENIENAESQTGAKVFHAGTKLDENGVLRAIGGRVLNVTANGDNLSNALDKAYKAIDIINAPSLFFRRDIGKKELSRK